MNDTDPSRDTPLHNKTPTKSTRNDDSTSNELTPTPKHKRDRTHRDYVTQRHAPDHLGFPANLNEAVNAAFAEDQYEAGVEIIDHSRANGIIPADHHLRILFAFALRPTPDPITYRQTAASSQLSGAISAPPSLPLIHRARTLLLDLAKLHGTKRIFRAIAPAKIAHAGGIDASNRTSNRSNGHKSARHSSYSGFARARHQDLESDEEDDQDGSFLDSDSAAAQLQQKPFLSPFPLAPSHSTKGSTPAVRDSWELLRVPPPGCLTEADIYRQALAAAEADETMDGTASLSAAAIRNIANQYPARRRGRGRGGSSTAAASSSRNTHDGFLTPDDQLQYSPAAIQRYNEIVYGKAGAKDSLRTRAVNGEALVLMASLWQTERRDIMYGSKKGKETAGQGGRSSELRYDEVNAAKALYGLSLAWDFRIDRKRAETMLSAAKKSTMPKPTPLPAASKKESAPPPPPPPTKTHPYFAQRFAPSAPSKGFMRGSSSIGSSPQSSVGGLPSSPAGPSNPASPTLARIARTGPQGCSEVGQALDVLFEVIAGNVLVSDRDGLCRSALALGGPKNAGEVDGPSVSAVSALGGAAPAVAAKWKEMMGGAGTALYEILQLTRQADSKSAPVLDADALERGITQRLAWADVGAEAIALIEQSLRANLAEEKDCSDRTRGRMGSPLAAPLDWETDPVLCWMKALVNHFKRVAGVLNKGPASKSTGRAGAEPSSSQRSDGSASAGLSPAAPKWERNLHELLQRLSPKFAWMEIRRERLAEIQVELQDEGLERFADIDAKRERRVWLDLMDVEAGEGESVAERVISMDGEISEMTVVRGQGRAKTRIAPLTGAGGGGGLGRRDRSPSILFVFSDGPAFRDGTRTQSSSSSSCMDTSDDGGSPGYEIVSVTPSKMAKDVPIVSTGGGSSAPKTTTTTNTTATTSTRVTRSRSRSVSAQPQAKERPKLSRSDAIQVQAREWVLDWGLDVFNDLKSARRARGSIKTAAPVGATLDDHDVRLNALLRVAEVVLGEVRRRRKGALIKFAVLMWARRCVPPSGEEEEEVEEEEEMAIVVNRASQASSARVMDWDDLQAPTSSGVASAYLGTQMSVGSDSSTPSARAVLDKLNTLCAEAGQSAESSLEQARVWDASLRAVWEEAIGLGIVPRLGKGVGEVKSEMGEAVNWAFTMEMGRLVEAIGVEVQGLSGTVLGWRMFALDGGAL
ncbi:hypothetical protein A4X09_0g4918 [Tilletia walkeri]|uniref:Uncharacterized protein n=1 Tax=Tilletia walkeri TaxID=117179 RepID=A0A8X7N862_9BASI|nr:hypothetical protein A4X09_0g4918 [Tilletia walkeri]